MKGKWEYDHRTLSRLAILASRHYYHHGFFEISATRREALTTCWCSINSENCDNVISSLVRQLFCESNKVCCSVCNQEQGKAAPPAVPSTIGEYIVHGNQRDHGGSSKVSAFCCFFTWISYFKWISISNIYRLNCIIGFQVISTYSYLEPELRDNMQARGRQELVYGLLLLFCT